MLIGLIMRNEALQNVIMTRKISGKRNSVKEIMLDNLRQWHRGISLIHRENLSTGHKLCSYREDPNVYVSELHMLQMLFLGRLASFKFSLGNSLFNMLFLNSNHHGIYNRHNILMAPQRFSALSEKVRPPLCIKN